MKYHKMQQSKFRLPVTATDVAPEQLFMNTAVFVFCARISGIMFVSLCSYIWYYICVFVLVYLVLCLIVFARTSGIIFVYLVLY